MSLPAADVAVVGGGLVGSALAYELVCRDVPTVLVDRHDPGRATDAGAGILSPETNRHPDDGWFAFAKAAGNHYRELVARLAGDGAEDAGFAECGLVQVALDEREHEWFVPGAELALRRSPGVVTELDPEEARRLFPPLAHVSAALLSPVAARVDGRRLNAALRATAARRGLDVRDTSVDGLLTKGDRVTGLLTGDGTIACGALTVAGGAWSAAFERELRATIPVRPLKGQIVHLELPGADSTRWPIVQPVAHHYLVSWPGGRVACGGTLEAAAGFDTRVTAAGLHELLRECLLVAPGLAGASVVDVRVGLRPASADGEPVVGPVPGWSNVHVVTGHGTEGLLLGPWSARLVADALLGAPPDPSLARLSPGRFAA
ncbi:MAG TPA: FAD-dependent oxidoreductase [Acidimicrobiales bacterium]|nr:FAD-dependent oxidoreductase [Acidimicrobiales bacterium]